MTLTTKILLGGAAMAALVALLWQTDAVKPGGPPSSTPGAAPQVEAASTLPSRPEKRVAPTKPTRRRGAEESAAPKPEDPKPEIAADVAPVPARGKLEVRARVLDSAGAAAAGARVEFGAMGSSIGGDGDADGRVAFSMDPAAGPPTGLEFVVTAVRCATRVVSSPLPREGGLDLGDIRLAAGGAVAGRVVDTTGAGIPDATVAVATISSDGAVLIDLAPRASTDADGRFVLRGAPVGKPALSADAKGFEEKRASVDVRIGEESHGVVIALTRVDPSARVRGVVLTPDGAPAPRATVTYHAQGNGSMSTGTLSADAAGRFDIEGGKDKAWRLSARDGEGRWSASATADVRSGAEDVVLRLTETRWAEVRVTRSDGKPAERFEVMLQALDGLVLDRMSEDERAGGVVKIKLPAQPFAFVATAPGCAVATAGPIDPSKVAARIEVRAQVLPGLRGRVTAGGAPVAKARVTLRGVVAPGMRDIRNGFACLTSSVMPDNGVVTEADGTFDLTLREAGKFVLRAEAPDLAPAEAGPFELTPEVGRAGIAIALTKGGAIEGRVLAAPGKTVDGVIVGASRGDGEARTVRAGPDGAFRFERLTPGQWIVKQTDREIRPGSSSVMITMGEARFDWSCKVDEGATTHFDVDLRVEAGTAVRGELRVDGAPGAGWKVSMLAGISIFTSEETAAGSVAESGSFRFVAPRPGDYLACVQSPKGLHVYAPVKVGAAETSVAFDFKTGQAKIRGATSGEPLVLLWEDAAGHLALAEAGVGADGTGGPTQMPAGRVRLVRGVPDQPDVRKWPTLAEGDLDAGGTVLLDVPAK